MPKILCLGDSNTYGWDPRAPLGGRYDRAWVDILQELIHAECVNMGRPGRKIPTAQAGLSHLLSAIDEQQGDEMLIMLGTNNLLLAPRDSAENTARKMETFLSFLQAKLPALPLRLVGVPPLMVDGRAASALVQELNHRYFALATKYSLPFYDPTPLSLPLSFDGVHLCEEAHSILAQGIAKVWYSSWMEE